MQAVQFSGQPREIRMIAVNVSSSRSFTLPETD
jgi:hypothetical protein